MATENKIWGSSDIKPRLLRLIDGLEKKTVILAIVDERGEPVEGGKLLKIKGDSVMRISCAGREIGFLTDDVGRIEIEN